MVHRYFGRRSLRSCRMCRPLGVLHISPTSSTHELCFTEVARVAVPVLMLFIATYFLLRPMLPDPGLTNAKIEVVRRDSTGGDLSQVDLSYIGSSVARQATGSGRYASVNRMEFTTDTRNHLRVLLIVDDDRAIGHTFVLPRTGYAIYRQTRGQWKEERAESRKSKISLHLNSPDGKSIDLRIEGPSCSSMAETFAPYH